MTVVAYRSRATSAPQLDGVGFVLASDEGRPLIRAARLSLISILSILRNSRRTRRLVVVAQSPYQGAPALAGRILARLFGRDVRLVIEVHGDWIAVATLLGRVPRRNRMLRGLSHFVLARADAIRTVSAFTADLVRSQSRVPVVTFAAFTDLDLFLAASADAERGHLLYAGVLTPVKGVDVLLDALALLRDRGHAVPLVLAGDGSARESLERQAERLGLRSLVTFRGHVDQRELCRLMATAHALVLPSHSEGFGLVCIEALACGTPVVASNVGGVREIVRDGFNGHLVPPGDARGLADALAGRLCDPAGTRAMGIRGRVDVAARFASDAWAAGQRRLIDLVAGATGTAGRAALVPPESPIRPREPETGIETHA